MDLREQRQLDMAGQVAKKVRARTRPWRSIIALVLALCCVAAVEYGKHANRDTGTQHGLIWAGSAAFLLFAVAASFGLSGQARNLLEPVIGQAHAGVLRYGLALVGIFAALVVTFKLAAVPVGQLVLGGAVTGVLLGIAAQQSLSNLFAGMVLLFARPFRVGDRVRFRAGALAGVLEGTVVDISITYVRLETADGPLFVPNSQALAAVVGPIPPGSGLPAGPAATQPADGPQAAGQQTARQEPAGRQAAGQQAAHAPGVPPTDPH